MMKRKSLTDVKEIVMKKKYWITRDGRYKVYAPSSPYFYHVCIWEGETKPTFIKKEENKKMIGSMDQFLFEHLFGFTPRKGSCQLVEIDLSIEEIT